MGQKKIKFYPRIKLNHKLMLFSFFWYTHLSSFWQWKNQYLYYLRVCLFLRGTVQNSFEWYKLYIDVDWTKFRMVSQAFFYLSFLLLTQETTYNYVFNLGVLKWNTTCHPLVVKMRLSPVFVFALIGYSLRCRHHLKN